MAASTLTYLTDEQRDELQEQIRDVPIELRNAFRDAFAAWKRTWFSGGLAFSSDPHTLTIGKAFDKLVALGPGILPLVIEALADPENFLALQLYDVIQPDGKLIVQFGPEDERILEGEQGRARRAVQAWFRNR
jgi:hypothetical protein